ncbi:MAG: chromosome partitioning protein ParB [Bacteroidetes bacterium MED-G13]|nr:MAG: chromosome partitioning protein ParB [Bacteroidetes bacterium MED-G13]|tara:strand:+ start:1864 stop:2736 length:873 start_codon:yes stop_codon:yes gene_type:complete
MIKKRTVLGRGLSSILNDSSNESSKISEKLNPNYSKISLKKISVNPNQPRTNFNDEILNELVQSIKSVGLIQPITVRKISKNEFQLISGERRLRAFKKLNLGKIPAYIRDVNDQESLEMALIENIQRDDLDSIEIAISYKRLIDEINLTQEELGKKIGKKRSTISNYLRLLKLNPIIQSGIKDNFISMGHGRALINIEERKLQMKIYEIIIKNNLSVRNTEKLINDLKKEKSISKFEEIYPKEITNAIKKLKSKYSKGSNVIFKKKYSGKVIIPFNSREEFLKINKNLNG